MKWKEDDVTEIKLLKKTGDEQASFFIKSERAILFIGQDVDNRWGYFMECYSFIFIFISPLKKKKVQCQCALLN